MPSNIINDVKEKIEVHERLARIEAILEAIQQDLEEAKDTDEKHDTKLDKILENDKSKLQRITKNEQKLKNIKASLYVLLVAISGALARWFV